MNVNRREFLKGCTAATLVGASGCSTMPAFGKLRKDEKLVAILSDCHVGNWKSPKYQGEKFAECIARVLALDPLPAKMLIPGDLAYLWGRKEDYELARQLLKPVVDAGIEITIGIGYCLLREYPDRAELSLVQYDYFSPKPLSADAAPNPAWQAIVRDNDGKRCTFVSTFSDGRATT